jgi:hypothetical protein
MAAGQCKRLASEFRLQLWIRTFLPFAMLLELVAATAYGFAYSANRWSLTIGADALLAVHFVFWDAVCFGPYFWFEPFSQSLRW